MNAITVFRHPDMGSQEIATLTNKRHDHVLRDVRTMLAGLYGEPEVSSGIPEKDNFEVFCERMGWGIDSPKLGDQRIQGVRVSRDSRGYVTEICLDYNHTMTLISGYSVKVRKAIIDRWQRLEQEAQPTHLLPQSFAEALRLAADLSEQKALAEQQRDVAIATKAEIGSRREATAMATASHANRQARRLQEQLDASKLWATIKRVNAHLPNAHFRWKILRDTSARLGHEVKKTFDANYTSVNSYHAAVWDEAYGIKLAELV